VGAAFVLDRNSIEIFAAFRVSYGRYDKWMRSMSLSAPASEVQKNFGAYHDKALAGEAVRVTKYGRETVYIVSAATFHALKQVTRRLGGGRFDRCGIRRDLKRRNSF